ncbi:hypothetical protein FVP45_13460, partial [Mycobacterium tuberculosis]|nr:hypothetical protein [Mycobacterium tuberculosis]
GWAQATAAATAATVAVAVLNRVLTGRDKSGQPNPQPPETDALADPLASSFALLLTVPLLELYAVLWRVGVVEVRGAHRGT